jgi:putative ABC transport system permease protein
MGMKVIMGRGFSKEMKTDSLSVIVNEAAANLLGFKQPLNKELYYPTDNMAKNLRRMQIVGVVKDFNFNSLRQNITPVIFVLTKWSGGNIAARINSNNIPALLAQVKQKWQSVSPNQEFNYSFMDQDFDATYRTEQRIGTIFISFTTMAIIIACLGLFGLAAYAAEQRTKEIGIRKVLGANISVIVTMLSKDFLRLVLISIVLATPLAWYCGHLWLQGFAYRDGIKWWILASAGVMAIVIAFVTISFQSIKAAIANPVKSLKSE